MFYMEWLRLNSADRDRMTEFWELTVPYFNEIITDAEDLDFFLGDKYRSAIEMLMRREYNGVEVYLAKNQEHLIGMMIYQYEGGDICLMEYYLIKPMRRRGIGSTLYKDMEKRLKSQGVLHIRLTPANEDGEAFWRAMGYIPTGEYADNEKEYFDKWL